MQMWQKTSMYIKKAGTIILAATIIVWALMTFPVHNEKSIEHSYAGQIGKFFEPVTKPLMGFDWKVNVSMLAGIAAKEIIITTLGTAYSITIDDPEESSGLVERISKDKSWGTNQAFALLFFVMLYIPCLSVLSVIKQETDSWKWAAFTVFYTLFVATAVSSAVYHLFA